MAKNPLHWTRKNQTQTGEIPSKTKQPLAALNIDLDEETKPDTPKHHWLHWRPTKKQTLIGLAVLVVVGVAAGSWLLLQNHNKTSSVAMVGASGAKSNTVASKLTGLQVAPAVAGSTVTAIMVENSDEARPQSGLSQAGIVFEALAEGGVTRFLTLYQEGQGQTTSIGPVRSARSYFIDWMMPFNAAYAHVGGSPAALAEIQTLGVRDMDQFYNGNYYTRVSSREAPHNVYTSIATLMPLEQSKGWTTSTFTGWPRKADAPLKKATTTSIDFDISGADMAAHYQYDPKLNSYLRSEAGAPMIDANTNQQLEPKVVIAIVVPWTNGALDASGAYYTVYSDIGDGQADVFEDGTVITGVWEKDSQSGQIRFINTATNKPIDLNAGQTWITVVGDPSEISYQ
ncbi:MAG TPA: DUF3048 domain-containing protein [Patescibacteria group bacterium]|jgi:hypothetical protein|nr:DUF3048 domain-containing protein [Patescibacteria group bacterium]